MTANAASTLPHQNQDIFELIIKLQNQVDKLNTSITHGEDPQDLDERIKKILERTNAIKKEHERELEEIKLLGMSPKAWKWISAVASGFTFISEMSAIGSNIPSAVLNGNGTEVPIIVATTVTTAISLVAAGVLAVVAYGQSKLDDKIDKEKGNIHEKEQLCIFLHAYKEFFSGSQANTLKQSNVEANDLKSCIEKLQNITAINDEDKDKWFAWVLLNLPKDNEYRKKLEQLLEQENEKIIPKKKEEKISSSSDQEIFLKVKQADQSANSEIRRVEKDALYEKHLSELRQEFNFPSLGTTSFQFKKKSTDAVINIK